MAPKQGTSTAAAAAMAALGSTLRAGGGEEGVAVGGAGREGAGAGSRGGAGAAGGVGAGAEAIRALKAVPEGSGVRPSEAPITRRLETDGADPDSSHDGYKWKKCGKKLIKDAVHPRYAIHPTACPLASRSSSGMRYTPGMPSGAQGMPSGLCREAQEGTPSLTLPMVPACTPLRASLCSRDTQAEGDTQKSIHV